MTSSQKSSVQTNSNEPADTQRRGFGRAAFGAAAIGAMAAAGLTLPTVTAQAQTITDVDIFNFALKLEYLEAEFYLRAATGVGLAASDTTGVGPLGAVTGGSRVPFRSSYVQQYAEKIAIDEQVHVKFIRAVLGGSAAARPAINFTDAFNGLALAAGLIVPGQTFNPFADEIGFLLGAFIFEDVGVTAYSGAAPLITSKPLLSYAASVLAVEAYHGGAIRALLCNLGGQAAANKITGLRAQLSASGLPGEGDERALTTPGGNFYNIAPTDEQGQTFRRTPRQVLNIVYGGVNAPTGLFFPAGMNGAIR